LPPDRQAQIRQLDEDLNGQSAAVRARLSRVLERYALWLETLPDEQRRQILQSADIRTRLRHIEAARDADRLRRLYPEERALLEKAPAGEARQRLKRDLLSAERERRRDWLIAFRNQDTVTDPRSRLTDYPVVVQRFVNDLLRPLLSKEEEHRLQHAEGQWPRFPRTLIELSDRHPVLLPGMDRGPVRLDELPEEIKARFTKLAKAENRPLFNRLRAAEGKWPEYAMVVTQVADQRKIELPAQLGPCTPKDFGLSVQQFLKKDLLPVLGPRERTRLAAAEGKWPLYPRVLLELATKHHLKVPGESARFNLPAVPPDPWDRYRLKPFPGRETLPDLPDQTLRDFAQTELTSFQRVELPWFSFDPQSAERLKQEYFKRHRAELDRLLQADKSKVKDPPRR
jgi:hypothetical protein